jgi:hypothetical protein
MLCFVERKFMAYLHRPTLALLGLCLAFITACNPVPPSVVASDFSIDGVDGTGAAQNVTIDLSAKDGCYTLDSLTAKVKLDKDVTVNPDPAIERDYTFPVVFIVTESFGTKVLYTVTVKGTACAPVIKVPAIVPTTVTSTTPTSTTTTSTTP